MTYSAEMPEAAEVSSVTSQVLRHLIQSRSIVAEQVVPGGPFKIKVSDQRGEPVAMRRKATRCRANASAASNVSKKRRGRMTPRRGFPHQGRVCRNAMTLKQASSRTIAHAAIGMVFLAFMALPDAPAVASGQALVIAEASYTALPALPGCAVSAHAVASALRGLGFSVDEQVDASSGALYAAIGRLTADNPVFVYVCSYVSGFEDRPFVLPVSASISRPADVLTQGLLAKTLLSAAASGKPAGMLAIDAVPTPGGPSVLPLDALTPSALPETLGLIAAANRSPGSTPTPLAAALVGSLHGPAAESAKVLAAVQQQLAAQTTVSVAALHVPSAGVFLASAPIPPVPMPPVPAVAPAETAAAAPESLPDEDQMTFAQRLVIQRALAHLGYYDAAADGVFGPETRAAIRRWQHEVHAPLTGHLTANEAGKLASSWD
jgi:hypothetical protein